MKFNIPLIEEIINNIDFNNPGHYQYSAKCWNRWNDDFLYKNDNYLKIDKDLSLPEKMNKLTLFRKTNATEQDFNQFFPDFKYDKYISPWDYDIRIVSERKIKEVAFELQEYIPLEYNQLCDLLKDLYWVSKDWSFKKISTMLMSYDKDLYVKSKICIEMRKKGLIA